MFLETGIVQMFSANTFVTIYVINSNSIMLLHPFFNEVYSVVTMPTYYPPQHYRMMSKVMSKH